MLCFGRERGFNLWLFSDCGRFPSSNQVDPQGGQLLLGQAHETPNETATWTEAVRQTPDAVRVALKHPDVPQNFLGCDRDQEFLRVRPDAHPLLALSLFVPYCRRDPHSQSRHGLRASRRSRLPE